jgi:hypothetical protein
VRLNLSPQIHVWESAVQNPRECERCSPATRAALAAWRQKQWSEFRQKAELIFNSCIDCEERGYWLFLLISSCENQYDLALREHYFRRWSEIPEWTQSPYCRYLRSYSEGMLAFFNCHLLEAERRFTLALFEASGIDYTRGEIRCHFHLGLVERDGLRLQQAKAHFLLAKQKAELLGWERFSQRSQVQLLSLERESDIDLSESTAELSFLQELILSQQIFKARSLYLKLARKNRKDGLKRGADNLVIYLPLLLLALGHVHVSRRSLNHLNDEVLRIRYFKLKRRLFGLDESEAAELDLLSRAQGRNQTIPSALQNSNETTVAGIVIERIKSEEMRSLLNLLLHRPEGVTKETIHIALWKYAYDPVLHDGRIYKMITRLKKLFGRADIVLNDYGRYRLNPAISGLHR